MKIFMLDWTDWLFIGGMLVLLVLIIVGFAVLDKDS